jgi:uncharacterized paraquat-inducible protein A
MRPLEIATLLTSLGLFIAGVLLPMMIIHPGFGDHTDLVTYLYPEMTAPRSVALLEGVLDLISEGAWLLAGLLGLFSLGLPGLKFFICGQALDGRRRPSHLAFIHVVGFMSMAEVVFVAVLAVTLKHLPGGTHVGRGPGLWCYLGSVLLLSALTARLYGAHRVEAEKATREERVATPMPTPSVEPKSGRS